MSNAVCTASLPKQLLLCHLLFVHVHMLMQMLSMLCTEDGMSSMFSQPLQSQGLEHLDVLANGVVVLAGYQAPDQEYFRHQRLAARGRSDIDQVGASVATLQSCSLPWVHLLNACLGICLHACSSRSFAVSTHLSCAWVEHKLQPIHQLEMRQISVQI